ncbi:MAG: ABC transporter substrate-binding protein [Clostridia bacterium]
MKKIVSLTLAILMTITCVFALSACGEENKGKTYYASYAIDLNLISPFNLPDTTGKKIIANTMEGLIINDRFGRYVGASAETWESNADKSVWTFHLRDNIFWFDCKGEKVREVLATDWADAMKYYSDHKNTKADISMIKTVISGLETYYENIRIKDDTSIPDYKKPANIKNSTRQELVDQFDTIVGVKADNATKTVTYTLTQSIPYFESFLVTELFLPLNIEFALNCKEMFGADCDKLLYNGPYFLKTWRTGVEFVLSKNPAHYDAVNMKVDTIKLQKVSNTNTTIEMFLRGELTSANIPGDEVANYLGNAKYKDYVNFKDKSTVTFWFYQNFQSLNKEFDTFIHNDNFRKALRHGVNRTAMARIYNNINPEAMLTNTIIPEGVCFDENGVDYTDYPELKAIKDLKDTIYNEEEAKRYFALALAELVEADGKTIKGVTPGTVSMRNSITFEMDGKLPIDLVFTHGPDSNDIQVAQVFKAAIEGLFADKDGNKLINVRMFQTGDDKYVSCNQYMGFDISCDSYSFKYGDPLAQLGRLTSQGEVNDGKFVIEGYDELVKQAAACTVLSQRYKIFSELEAMLINGGYLIPWENGGGVFEMTRAIPFLAPRGGFGLSRFSYRWMDTQEEPLTTEEYKKYEKEFNDALAALNGAN